MTYQDQDIVQLLREIGIEKDKDEVTIRDVNTAFRKQVKKNILTRLEEKRQRYVKNY